MLGVAVEFKMDMYKLQGTAKEVLRFAKTKDFPLSVRFKDGCDIEHKVTLEKKDESYQCTIPSSHEIKWEHDELDRTGLSKETVLATIKFAYVEGIWPWSHGIVVNVDYYQTYYPNDHFTSTYYYKQRIV